MATHRSGSVVFTGIPNFAPEILRRVRLARSDEAEAPVPRPGKRWPRKASPQVFKPAIGSQWIVGVVGALQLDVLKSRLVAEYDLDADLEPAPYDAARWLAGDAAEIEKFMAANRRRHGHRPRWRAGLPGQECLGSGLCRGTLSESEAAQEPRAARRQRGKSKAVMARGCGPTSERPRKARAKWSSGPFRTTPRAWASGRQTMLCFPDRSSAN